MEARRPAKPLRPKRRVTEVALRAHANAGLRAHDWPAVSRASSSESPRFAGQLPLQHQRATSFCEITPFSMQFLRRSQCRFYAILIACFTLGILDATLAQLPDHRIAWILGRVFRPRPLPENASHSEARFRDAVSVCEPSGKRVPF